MGISGQARSTEKESKAVWIPFRGRPSTVFRPSGDRGFSSSLPTSHQTKYTSAFEPALDRSRTKSGGLPASRAERLRRLPELRRRRPDGRRWHRKHRVESTETGRWPRRWAISDRLPVRRKTSWLAASK